MTIPDLIDALGGTSAVAAELGVPTSTVHSWRANNHVPAWRQPKMLELALAQQIDFSAANFPERNAA